MIERIARRAGGFASTTALRWLGALGESVPDVELPTRKPTIVERATAPLAKGMGGTLAKGALAGAVALVSSNKTVRRGLANGLDKIADSLGPASSSKGRSGSPSGSAGSNGYSGNGSNGSVVQKTRTELYEMAKKMDIPGRSSMSKEELEKALKIK